MLVLCGLFVSCASINDLPTSADLVDFSLPDGPLDIASPLAPAYQLSYEFSAGERIDLEMGLRAAKAGIVYAGLDVVRADIDQRVVIGCRGASFHLSDNRTLEYVGIYLEIYEGGLRATIYISGDVSVGFGSNPIGELQERVKTGMDIFLHPEFQVPRHTAAAPEKPR